MKAVIIDMDGTLCDVSSIRYFVNPDHPDFPGFKDWESFHGGAIDCPPNEEALTEYRRAKDEGLAILIVTARMEQWALPTLLWLSENDIEHDALFMRVQNDYRKDYVIKREILEEIKEQGYEPVRAVDDNPAVIELWEEEGIETVKIQGWEEQ